MNAKTGAEIATVILSPLVQEVATWIDGRDKPGTKRPRVLSLLPNELQSEIAQQRLENRYRLGLEKRPEPPIAPAAAQTSELRVTTGGSS